MLTSGLKTATSDSIYTPADLMIGARARHMKRSDSTSKEATVPEQVTLVPDTFICKNKYLILTSNEKSGRSAWLFCFIDLVHKTFFFYIEISYKRCYYISVKIC